MVLETLEKDHGGARMSFAQKTEEPNKVRLFIDADILCYKSGLSGIYERPSGNSFDSEETIHVEDIELALRNFKRGLDDIFVALCPFDVPEFYLCFTVGKSQRLKIDPTYKGHRKKAPEIIYKLKQRILEEYPKEITLFAEGIEADDILGMHQTEDTILVSEDKDLLQIPGKHWNPRYPELGVTKVSQDYGDVRFYRQILIGDPCDNYKGCPNVGIEKAKLLITDGTSNYQRWQTVVAMFQAMGSTEEEALKTARLAYILHPKDNYDYLWEPPKKPEGESHD